ncbi:MAG TPA: pyrimidine dimer DNA glycosylase/endonuclease V [Steroidobacteraceae bacterium]|nr:pyrimidine dimer DNA glycosylase/endonuclease V [Steroidobacteraceae bacterium]
MRIWSLHPKYLDARGLVALWREGLLAQAVLSEKTRGYVHHPQLLRFRNQRSPIGSIAAYLSVVHEEAASRGYEFVAKKISRARSFGQIEVTRGQIHFEWRHLMRKLKTRDPRRYDLLKTLKRQEPHPLFKLVRGNVERWEKGATSLKKPSRRQRQKSAKLHDDGAYRR